MLTFLTTEIEGFTVLLLSQTTFKTPRTEHRITTRRLEELTILTGTVYFICLVFNVPLRMVLPTHRNMLRCD
jgi:hypothetical protein